MHTYICIHVYMYTHIYMYIFHSFGCFKGFPHIQGTQTDWKYLVVYCFKKKKAKSENLCPPPPSLKDPALIPTEQCTCSVSTAPI